MLQSFCLYVVCCAVASHEISMSVQFSSFLTPIFEYILIYWIKYFYPLNVFELGINTKMYINKKMLLIYMTFTGLEITLL